MRPCFRLQGVLLVAGLLLAPVVSAPAWAVSDFREALRTALEESPELARLRAELDAAQERRILTRAANRPTLQLSVRGQGAYSSDDASAARERNSATAMVGVLDAAWQIHDSGATARHLEQRDAELEVLRLALVLAGQDVLLEAATGYLAVLRRAELLTLAQNNAARLEAERKAARDRLRVGSGTRTSVAQAEARLAAAEAAVARSAADLRVARSEFERVVGAAPGASLSVPASLPALPGTLAAAQAASLAANPRLRSSRLQEAAARAGIGAARAAQGFRVSVFGTAQLSHDTARASGREVRDDFTAGLQLQQPLVSGGALESAVREAAAQLVARQASTAAIERQLRVGVVAAWEDGVTARAAIASGETRVEAAELAYAGTRESTRVGLGSTLDVLDAEQEARDARVALVQARYDAIAAAFRLRHAVGTLDPEALGL